jgi:hypothetical protein
MTGRTAPVAEAASTRFAALRALARDNNPYPPLAFLRAARAAALREWFCDDCMRPGADGCLAFEHGRGAARWLFVANLLPWDSEWLGRRIARIDLAMPVAAPFERPLEPPEAGASALCDELRRRGVEYVFAPVPARHVAFAKALGFARFALLEARVTYWRDRLEAFEPQQRNPTRVASSADVEGLGEVAAATVNPFDRFHAEEYFDRRAVDRAMREWVNASVTKGFADEVLVPDFPGKPPRAFMTLRYHRDRWRALGVNVGQHVLSAVAPDAKGWFRHLVAEGTLRARELGATAMYCTTQANNKATIRALESLGYAYGECTLVFRRVLAGKG